MTPRPTRNALRAMAVGLGLIPGANRGRPRAEETVAAWRLGLVYTTGDRLGIGLHGRVLDVVDQLRHERGVGGAAVIALLDQVARLPVLPSELVRAVQRACNCYEGEVREAAFEWASRLGLVHHVLIDPGAGPCGEWRWMLTEIAADLILHEMIRVDPDNEQGRAVARLACVRVVRRALSSGLVPSIVP